MSHYQEPLIYLLLYALLCFESLIHNNYKTNINSYHMLVMGSIMQQLPNTEHDIMRRSLQLLQLLQTANSKHSWELVSSVVESSAVAVSWFPAWTYWSLTGCSRTPFDSTSSMHQSNSWPECLWMRRGDKRKRGWGEVSTDIKETKKSREFDYKSGWLEESSPWAM